MSVAVFVALATGCAGDPGTGSDSSSGDSGKTTGPSPSGRASVHVELVNPWIGDPTPHTVLGAVYVDEPGPFVNLAQCLFGIDPWCATEVPALDGAVDVEPPELGFLASLDTLDAGTNTRVAVYDLRRNDDNGVFTYLETHDALVSFDDLRLRVDVSGGDGWPTAVVADTAPVPTPMVSLSHDPNRSARFYDADPVRLRWLAGTSGDVDLLVSTEQGQTLRRIADSGAYDLDLQPLGLSHESIVDLRLIRSNRADGLAAGGGEMDLTVQYVERFQGVYYTIGSRDDLTPTLADTCEQALKAESVSEGNYEGTFASFANDLDPGTTGCTGLPASAPDAIVPVDVRPLQKLTAHYHLLEDDASIYLLTDCGDVASCDTGEDSFAGPNVGGEEILEWTNNGTETRTVYLVLDGTTAVTSLFRLDIELSEIGGDVLQNFCADAIQQGPVETGFYGGTLADHIDVLPAYLTKACKAPGQFGGEGVAQVFLPAGASLHAKADTPDGAPQLFLLSNCTVSNSCFATGNGEIDWANPSPYGQTFYVVLDSATGIGEYALDVEIQ